jgi:hypothetical protein
MILTPDIITLLLEASSKDKSKPETFVAKNDRMSKILYDEGDTSKKATVYRGLLKVNNARMKKYVKLGADAKRWYHDMSERIYNELGESDASLFLLMLASTSPKNMLSGNLKEASKVFRYLEQDMEENFAQIDEFIEKVPTNLAEARRYLNHEHRNLFIRQLERQLIGMEAKFLNIVRVLKFYRNSGYSLRKDEVLSFLSSGINWKSATKKDFWTGETISKFKVMNFAINLIDPDFQYKNRWYPVTIDSWMIKFFFPFEFDTMTLKDWNSFAGSIMGDASKYLAAQKLINKFAKRYDMTPVEFQASLWVGMLRESGKSVDTFEVALDNRIKALQLSGVELEDITFSTVMTALSEIPEPKKQSNKREDDSIPVRQSEEFIPDFKEGPAPF